MLAMTVRSMEIVIEGPRLFDRDLIQLIRSFANDLLAGFTALKVSIRCARLIRVRYRLYATGRPSLADCCPLSLPHGALNNFRPDSINREALSLIGLLACFCFPPDFGPLSSIYSLPHRALNNLRSADSIQQSSTTGTLNVRMKF